MGFVAVLTPWLLEPHSLETKLLSAHEEHIHIMPSELLQMLALL